MDLLAVILFCVFDTPTMQIHKRLIDLLSFPAYEAQGAAVGALYNLAEVNMDCKLKLASERW